MTESSSPRTLIACPTRGSAVAALTRVFGEVRAQRLWRAAADAAGVRDVDHMPLAEVRAVCQRLELQPGVAGVIGASLRIRCDTYGFLQEREGDR